MNQHLYDAMRADLNRLLRSGEDPRDILTFMVNCLCQILYAGKYDLQAAQSCVLTVIAQIWPAVAVLQNAPKK